MTDSPNSGILLARVHDGDARALEDLLLEHLPALAAYVRLKAGALVAAKESVSDLVQSVCVEVLRDAEGFVYQGEPQFRAWLFKQAMHKIVNKNVFYSRKRRDAGREAHLAAGGADAESGVASLSQLYQTLCTPSRVVQEREAVEAFEAAFARLPDDYREAIALKHLAGMSHEQIAQQMERSEGAVKNLVYRGLARLSAMLDSDGGSDAGGGNSDGGGKPPR